jgi:hypothetical protein
MRIVPMHEAALQRGHASTQSALAEDREPNKAPHHIQRQESVQSESVMHRQLRVGKASLRDRICCRAVSSHAPARPPAECPHAHAAAPRGIAQSGCGSSSRCAPPPPRPESSHPAETRARKQESAGLWWVSMRLRPWYVCMAFLGWQCSLSWRCLATALQLRRRGCS